MSVPCWQSMTTAPKDGTEIIVLLDSATVPIVRSAWYVSESDVEYDRDMYGDGPEGRHLCDIGWWSYRHSITQEKLEGYDLPVAWMPMPSYSEFMR